jgi:hypothetical protein
MPVENHAKVWVVQDVKPLILTARQQQSTPNCAKL